MYIHIYIYISTYAYIYIHIYMYIITLDYVETLGNEKNGFPCIDLLGGVVGLGAAG